MSLNLLHYYNVANLKLVGGYINQVNIRAYSNGMMKYEYFISVDDWYDSRCKEIDDKKYIKTQCIDMVEIFENNNHYLNYYDKDGTPMRFEVFRNGVLTNTEFICLIKGCFLSVECIFDGILYIKYLCSATRKYNVSNIVVDILNGNKNVYTQNIVILEKSQNDFFSIPLQGYSHFKCKVTVKRHEKTIKEFVADF